MSTERFTTFLGDLRAGLGVIADNAGFHGSPWQRRRGTNGVAYYRDMSKCKSALLVRKAEGQTGIKLVYGRPRSPEFNPCEHVFSVVKSAVRKDCPTNKNDLILSIERALAEVGDLKRTFEHCLREAECSKHPETMGECQRGQAKSKPGRIPG